MRIALQLAASSDVSRLASIADEAFKSDRHTQLKANSRYGDYNHEESMVSALSDWLAQSPHRCRVLKAIDEETGEIVGWVTWGFHGYDDEVGKTSQALPAEPSHAANAGQKSRQRLAQSPPGYPTVPSSMTGITRLEHITNASMQEWIQYLMPSSPPTKCLYIMSLVVSPHHQNRGVGQALIRDGTDQADRDGVFCWVHSSDAGWRAFEKAGFEVVGELTVDLDDFARQERAKREIAAAEQEAAEEDGEKVVVAVEEEKEEEYGSYTFRYMKRDPR